MLLVRFKNLVTFAQITKLMLTPNDMSIDLVFIGLGVAQALATILQAASLFILASDNLNLNAQIVGMCFYGIGRLTLFGMFFTNVGKRFGYTHFGTLAGCGLLLSAIGSLTQYPLIAIAVEGGESVVNTMCGVAILALLLPYCFWLGLRERRECRNA